MRRERDGIKECQIEKVSVCSHKSVMTSGHASMSVTYLLNMSLVGHQLNYPSDKCLPEVH